MYRTGIFAAISFWIVTVLAGVLPLFFLPGSWGGIVAVKGTLLYTGVFLATACWLFTQFLQGSITVPKHRILVVVCVWVLAVLVSALASANTQVSMWGRGFAVDSFATVLVLGLLVFLIASFAREQKRLITLFLATFIGSAVTVLLQVVLYIVQAVSLAHISTNGTVVGSWVDFSYLVTLTLILALLSYEVLAPKGFFRIFSLVTMVLCTIVLVFLNFKVAWIVTIVSTLLIFVYNSSVERSLVKLFPKGNEQKERSRFPFFSFGILMIGVFFFLTASSIGSRIAEGINLNFNDVRPSFTTTTNIVGQSLVHDPFFGAGPGRFAQIWDRYHSTEINQTTFWNTSFDNGFGMLQTIIATQGIIPTLLFLIVIILSIIQGFKLFSYKFPDRFSRFIAVVSLIMVLAFTILFVLSSPSIVLITFGFLYIGLLLGVSQMVGKTDLASWNYLKDPRKSFLTILILVVCIIVCIGAVYIQGKRFASIVVFNKALTARDFETGDRFLARALAQAPNDIYWRARASIYAGQFVTLAQTESPDKTQLQVLFDGAEASARAAIAWDSTDAHNWFTLAQVYQLVAVNGNPDALVVWRDAAKGAHDRNPNNPLYVISQAQAAFTAKEYQGALDFYAAARTLAPTNPETWIGMVDALNSLGRKTEATELLDQFAIVFPSIKGVPEKKQSIAPALVLPEKSDTKE